MAKDTKGHGSEKRAIPTAPKAKTQNYMVKMGGNGRTTAIHVKAKSADHAEQIAKKDPAFGKQYTRVQAKISKYQ